MKKSSKPGPLTAPLPAVMVSCGDMEKSNIITIAWTGIINSHPPMTYISVMPRRMSHSIIAEKGEFVINLTTAELAKAMDFCGVKSGRDVDKFEHLGLTREAGDIVSAPMIAESPVNIECKVTEIKEFPSHDMFIAEIVAVHVDEKYVDENGNNKRTPYTLVYYDVDTFEQQLDDFVAESESNLNEAKAALETAQAEYDAAVAAKEELTSGNSGSAKAEWDSAVEARIAAETAYNAAKDAYDAALEERDAAQEAYDAISNNQ